MIFTTMIAGLKQGRRYRRPAWPDGDLIMFRPREPGITQSKIVGSIIKLTAGGDVESFSAGSDDLNASDWVEIE